MHVLTWRRVNNALLAAIILLNLYVITAPFAPRLLFWWQRHHTSRDTQLTQLIHPPQKSSSAAPAPAIPSQNAVVIPSMMLNTPILEGSVRNEYQTLDQGVWRWPGGSTPDKGGNTILLGHRFTYTNPRGIFYELDKVHVDDDIGVFWNSKEYLYKTISTTVVPPTDTDILDQTKQSEITLYTCTPTWNPKDRLVVVAELQTITSYKTL